MYIKRKIYYTFASVIFVTLYGSNNISCYGSTDQTPARFEEQTKPSPKGVDEIHEDSVDVSKSNIHKEQKKEQCLAIAKSTRPSALFSSDVFDQSLSKKKGIILNVEGSLLEEDDANTSDAPLPLSIQDHSSFRKGNSHSNVKNEKLNLEKLKILGKFKIFLSRHSPGNPVDPADTEQFLNVILNEIVLLKQDGIDDRTIGITFNETAEKFRKHDYFLIDRFECTLTSVEQNTVNTHLMNNWQKWYTYKLLARYFTKEDFTREDATIIAASMQSDDLDVYDSPQYYEKIFVPGKLFYDNKNEFGKNIYMKLTERAPGFSAFIRSLPKKIKRKNTYSKSQIKVSMIHKKKKMKVIIYDTN